MVKRGRPIKSEVRQNIVDILYVCGTAYGYQLMKYYGDIFRKIDSELIYYHLKKGLETGEIELGEVKTETGDFSWGKTVEKTYYKIGKDSNPRLIPKIKEYFDKKNEAKV